METNTSLNQTNKSPKLNKAELKYALTKFVRLLCYNFLSSKEIVMLIAKLSMVERENLVGSGLANEKRTLSLVMP